MREARARLLALAKAHKKKIAAVVIFAIALAAGLSTEAAGRKTLDVLAVLAGLLGG